MGSGSAIPPVIVMSGLRCVFVSRNRVETLCGESRAYALDTCYRIMFLYFTMNRLLCQRLLY
jgi:hypothetical protein